MTKFILHKHLTKIIRKEITAENWDDAIKKLEEYLKEPIPEDCILNEEEFCIEYIGD